MSGRSKMTTEPGSENRRGQRVIRNTGLPGQTICSTSTRWNVRTAVCAMVQTAPTCMSANAQNAKVENQD